MSIDSPVAQRSVNLPPLAVVDETGDIGCYRPSVRASSSEQITSNTLPAVAHHLESLFSDSHRETFDYLPQQIRTALLETPYLKNKGEVLTDGEFGRVLAAAGHLESYVDSTSADNLQLFANAALGNVLKPGDTELVLKALDSLPLSALNSGDGKLDAARAAVEQLKNTKSVQNYSHAYDALAELVVTLPKENKGRDNIAGLAEQLRCGGLELLRDQFKEKLTEQFHGLEKGGSARNLSLSFEIGPALGLFNLNAASLTVETKYTFTVFGSDDTKIRAKHNASLDLSST